ncbi:MAG: phosphatase PAP2 family protein [Nitrososphaera sp.]|jgi:membrane-associated phospholipid phosphatase
MKYTVTGLTLLASLAALAFLVITNSGLDSWDLKLFEKINNPQGNILDKIMVALTKYGREFVWIGVMALLFILGKKDARRTAVLLTITFLILIPSGTILKDEINRHRPSTPDEKLLIKGENDPSFPSGHATIVSAGAFVLLTRFNRGKQIIFSLVLAAEAILVMYSRMYVGNHYPLDVLGGIFLGAGVAAMVIASSKYLEPLFLRIDKIGIR